MKPAVSSQINPSTTPNPTESLADHTLREETEMRLRREADEEELVFERGPEPDRSERPSTKYN